MTLFSAGERVFCFFMFPAPRYSSLLNASVEYEYYVRVVEYNYFAICKSLDCQLAVVGVVKTDQSDYVQVTFDWPVSCTFELPLT